jgi:penicillin-binding protein 1A
MWLENKFNKAQIMMMYLNRVYFGAGAYGIDAAARKYFGKSARQLGVYEAAVLAGSLKGPSKYSPAHNAKNAQERAFIVLQAMEDQGFIKNAKAIEEAEAKAVFKNAAKKQSGYMYFCDFVYDQAKKILGEVEDDMIIVSSLDTEKQQAAEEAIRFYMETEANKYKISQMALICMGRDGQVEAMVGGTEYTMTQFNRATQALRMPGSAFKIFVYGAALEYGYQLGDKISDAPVTIAGWTAKNYKWRERGEISVLDGFTYSVNSISIRLAKQIGLNRIVKFANKLGIGNVSRHDMSIAIGTTAMTLKDLTSAYTSFMDGIPIWPYAIYEIRTKSGKVLYSHVKETKKRIIDRETLANGQTLLRSVISRGTGRAANINEHIYGKTGSNGNIDALFVGFYNPPGDPESGFSCGIWCGNDNNESKMTQDSTGGRIPARVYARFAGNVIDKKLSNKKIVQSEKAKIGLRSALDEL